jgi:hypothetical protein
VVEWKIGVLHLIVKWNLRPRRATPGFTVEAWRTPRIAETPAAAPSLPPPLSGFAPGPTLTKAAKEIRID